MASNDEKIDEFMTITGCGQRTEAEFFLESSQWNVQTAVSMLFDGAEAAEIDAEPSSNVTQPPDEAPKPNFTVKGGSQDEGEQRCRTWLAIPREACRAQTFSICNANYLVACRFSHKSCRYVGSI